MARLRAELRDEQGKSEMILNDLRQSNEVSFCVCYVFARNSLEESHFADCQKYKETPELGIDYLNNCLFVSRKPEYILLYFRFFPVSFYSKCT